jgi:hypothetical protein
MALAHMFTEIAAKHRERNEAIYAAYATSVPRQTVCNL